MAVNNRKWERQEDDRFNINLMELVVVRPSVIPVANYYMEQVASACCPVQDQRFHPVGQS